MFYCGILKPVTNAWTANVAITIYLLDQSASHRVKHKLDVVVYHAILEQTCIILQNSDDVLRIILKLNQLVWLGVGMCTFRIREHVKSCKTNAIYLAAGNQLQLMLRELSRKKCVWYLQCWNPLICWDRYKWPLFADGTFKCIFVNKNVRISIEISLSIRLKYSSIDSGNGLAGQATSHYLNKWWLVYWRIYASLNLNEF